jgi:hypothetical protein
MIGYENIVAFYIILNKLFETGKNIKIQYSFTVDVIGYEYEHDSCGNDNYADDNGGGGYVTHTEVQISKVDDLYKCYSKEVSDFREFFGRLERCDKIKFDSIMAVGKDLISNIDNLIQKCDQVTQGKHRKINFDKLNAVETKNSILKLVFKMSYTFDKLLELLQTDYIKRYYNGRSVYNWILYILNTLCNSAFKDATTDADGRVSLETIKYICYSMFQTDEIVSRSNRNIVNRIFL